ncbi:hypothetical protein [Corynebacterium aquatimens]|uniref:hypothetical protein n=1 Tax=Corynebacterium aquatimens TaxID=1190508 RepID=UPI00254009F1|nr:hypothetical protein [Corynebacterium aquatimens]
MSDNRDAPANPAAPKEKEWWEEDGLPWNSKPTKADYWCLAWFGFVGLFGLGMIRCAPGCLAWTRRSCWR